MTPYALCAVCVLLVGGCATIPQDEPTKPGLDLKTLFASEYEVCLSQMEEAMRLVDPYVQDPFLYDTNDAVKNKMREYGYWKARTKAMDLWNKAKAECWKEPK